MPKTGFYSDGYFNNSESPVNTPLQSYTRVNKNNTTTVFQNVITLSESQDDGVTRAYYKNGHILSQADQSTLFNITTSTGVHSIENFSFKINSDSTISGVVANTGIDTFSNIFINFQKIAANKFTNGIRASSEGVSLDSYPISSVEPLSAGLPFDSKYFLTYKGIFSTLFCKEKTWRMGRPARGIYGLTHDEAFIKSIPLGEIVTQNGTQYYVDSFTNRIRKITPQGAMSTIAGVSSIPVSSINDFNRSVDGIGSEAIFSNPRGIAINNNNTILYVVDSHCVRQVPVDGTSSTSVYSGVLGVSGSSDGDLGEAKYKCPQGIINDGNDNFLIADTGNHTLRKVINGTTSTYAGIAGVSGQTNTSKEYATFSYPYDLVKDTNGNIFITEYGNNTIRKIDTNGNVTTFAGSTAGEAGFVNSTNPVLARFNGPQKITIDNSNNLYVVDSKNYAIRKITPSAIVTTLDPSSDFINLDIRTPLNFGVTVSSANWLDLQQTLWGKLSTVNTLMSVSSVQHPLFNDPLIEIQYGYPRIEISPSISLNRLPGVIIARELSWKNILNPSVFNTYSDTTLSGLTISNYNLLEEGHSIPRYCFYNKGLSGTDFRDGIFYSYGIPGVGVTKWNILYKYNKRTTGIASATNDYALVTQLSTLTLQQTALMMPNCFLSVPDSGKLTLYLDGVPYHTNILQATDARPFSSVQVFPLTVGNTGYIVNSIENLSWKSSKDAHFTFINTLDNEYVIDPESTPSILYAFNAFINGQGYPAYRL